MTANRKGLVRKEKPPEYDIKITPKPDDGGCFSHCRITVDDDYVFCCVVKASKEECIRKTLRRVKKPRKIRVEILHTYKKHPDNNEQYK